MSYPVNLVLDSTASDFDVGKVFSQKISVATICWCVCTWQQFHGLWFNYEVMVFQPRTVTPLHLGYIAIVTLQLAFLPHLFLLFVIIVILPAHSYRPAHP